MSEWLDHNERSNRSSSGAFLASDRAKIGLNVKYHVTVLLGAFARHRKTNKVHTRMTTLLNTFCRKRNTLVAFVCTCVCKFLKYLRKLLLKITSKFLSLKKFHSIRYQFFLWRILKVTNFMYVTALLNTFYNTLLFFACVHSKNAFESYTAFSLALFSLSLILFISRLIFTAYIHKIPKKFIKTFIKHLKQRFPESTEFIDNRDSLKIVRAVFIAI